MVVSALRRSRSGELIRKFVFLYFLCRTDLGLCVTLCRQVKGKQAMSHGLNPLILICGLTPHAAASCESLHAVRKRTCESLTEGLWKYSGTTWSTFLPFSHGPIQVTSLCMFSAGGLSLICML